MKNQNQATKVKLNKQNQRSTGPGTVAEPADDLVARFELPTGPIAAAGNGSIEAQANWLGKGRLQGAQRRALAAQIGRVQGNQHLQRVIASLQQDERASRYAPETRAEKKPLVHKMTPSVQQKSKERKKSKYHMAGWLYNDETPFEKYEEALEGVGYKFTSYVYTDGAWKKTGNWQSEFFGIDPYTISTSDVAWDIVGPKPPRGRRVVRRKIPAHRIRGVCVKLWEKYRPKGGKSWTEQFIDRVDELSGEHPWVPAVVWRKLKNATRTGNIRQPHWSKREPSGRTYRKHVVVRVRRMFGSYHIEVYLEFATSEEYYRTKRHMKGRSAIHAAEAAESWNTKMWAYMNNPNELRSFEQIRKDLMEAQWLYLMKSLLIAVAGVSTMGYKDYGASGVAKGLGLFEE